MLGVELKLLGDELKLLDVELKLLDVELKLLDWELKLFDVELKLLGVDKKGQNIKCATRCDSASMSMFFYTWGASPVITLREPRQDPFRALDLVAALNMYGSAMNWPPCSFFTHSPSIYRDARTSTTESSGS